MSLHVLPGSEETLPHSLIQSWIFHEHFSLFSPHFKVVITWGFVPAERSLWNRTWSCSQLSRNRLYVYVLVKQVFRPDTHPFSTGATYLSMSALQDIATHEINHVTSAARPSLTHNNFTARYLEAVGHPWFYWDKPRKHVLFPCWPHLLECCSSVKAQRTYRDSVLELPLTSLINSSRDSG